MVISRMVTSRLLWQPSWCRAMVMRGLGQSLVLVTLLTVGLLSVPVECTVAAGPHSIFTDAQAVATLQGRAADADHAHHASSSTPAHPDLRGEQGHDVFSTDQPAQPAHTDESTAADGSTSLPAPAGIALDAVVAISMPGIDPPMITVGSVARALTTMALPFDHPPAAPTPPPP